MITAAQMMKRDVMKNETANIYPKLMVKGEEKTVRGS